MPINVFSTRFQAAEVPKTNHLQVPFVGLEQSASVTWNPANGYGTGDFNIQSRAVPVNIRRYQALSWNSGDLLGLPVDVLVRSMNQKIDKLAYDVLTDICSAITPTTVANPGGNYGAPTVVGAAAAFDTDAVQDFATGLTTANWPRVGRSLILNENYTGNLKKDPALKNAQASGSDQTLREGATGRISGFDIFEAPVPTNGLNLVGFAALPSALLIASAPIEPEQEVKDRLSDYRVMTDPDTGLTLTYRAWGSADFDQAKRIVEFCYGYAPGDAAQLVPLTSA